MKTRSRKLHGKFVLWDSDNVIVTSLNWASASADDRNPIGELGVHVNSPGFADVVRAKLENLLPELAESSNVFDRDLRSYLPVPIDPAKVRAACSGCQP
jgi:hypothetical protein